MPIAPYMSALPHRLLVTLGLLVSLQSQALTLGRVQGAALIGRPLDVSVQVQLEPNQSITSACFEADVFHADTRQNPAGVTVRLEPTASPQNMMLRIRSDSRINEPVVTVYVRAGCAQMSSRRYVMLADIVSEQAAPIVPRVAAVPLVDPAPSSVSDTPRVGQGGSAGTAVAPAPGAPGAGTEPRSAVPLASRAPAATPRPARTPRSAQRQAAPSRAPAPQAAAQPKTGATRSGSAQAPAAAPARQATGQSRLTLDPLEMLSERVATLETQATTATAPPSERDVREAERLERLETSVKALLALAEKNEASLRDVRSRLEKSQADRFSNTVVYALLGLLLLSLLAIAYLLTRVSRRPAVSASRWFEAGQADDIDSMPPPVSTSAGRGTTDASSDGSGSTSSEPGALSTPAPLSRPATLPQTDRLPIEPTQPMPQAPGVREGAAAPGQVDVSLVEMSESTFDRLMQSGVAHNAVRPTRETVPLAVAKSGQAGVAASRPRINSEELIDIRQRAEFFVTLGQTDQAVQVLEARIAQDGASCPQAFLDLLKLFHSLGLKDDFNQVRSEFSRLFNARVPEFAQFGDEGHGLEEYPGTVDRLIAVWSRPTVLDTLEQMVYRARPEGGDDEAFDLAAFRDLLMLHAVAQSVRAGAAGRSGVLQAPMPVIDTSQPVDIDLSELIVPEVAPTLVLPASDGETGASASNAPTGPTDNLIDFDLSDVGFGTKQDNKDT